MNRTRLLLIGLVALLLSGFVTVIVYRELDSRLNPTVEEDDQIVVAAEKLQLGTRLEAFHLKTAPWPKGTPIDGSFATIEEVVGRGVIVPMFANEPVLDSKLAPAEAGAGLTSAIPEGMRAMSVKVNDVVGVAGFVLPGTRVDVIVTGTPTGEKDEQISKVILENVQVLAAGQNIERDAQGQPQSVQVITLLVDPDDSQKLTLASADGDIRLALRNPLDLDQADPDPFKKSSLYSGPSSQAAPPEIKQVVKRVAPPPKPVVVAPPPPTTKTFEVELIQGSDRENLSFEKELTRKEKKSEQDLKTAASS
jgi:pilus assembly protein CpaB